MIGPAVFWSSVALVWYSYLGFPALVLARGAVCPRPLRGSSDALAPSVTVVIAAHNETEVIAEKLRSILAQDYQGELSCVVVSDGSTDHTVRVASSVTSSGAVEVIDAPRVGKAAALRVGVSRATGDVVVFTDANSLLAPDAVRELVAPFSDPAVGGVAGDQRYVDTGDPGAGERIYWSFDRLVKVAESRAGNVISATGALYAVRRPLVLAVPEGVTDDFTISTGVIDQGYRLVFAPRSVAYEPTAESLPDEYRRKVRVMTRGLRAVILRRRLLDPRRTGFYAVQLFSHKVLRRLSVIPLLCSVVASVALRHRPFYRRVAGVEVSGVALVAVSAALTRTRLGSNRLVAVAAFFGLSNVAALHALWNLATGRQIRRWTPARR